MQSICHSRQSRDSRVGYWVWADEEQMALYSDKGIRRDQGPSYRAPCYNIQYIGAYFLVGFYSLPDCLC